MGSDDYREDVLSDVCPTSTEVYSPCDVSSSPRSEGSANITEEEVSDLKKECLTFNEENSEAAENIKQSGMYNFEVINEPPRNVILECIAQY